MVLLLTAIIKNKLHECGCWWKFKHKLQSVWGNAVMASRGGRNKNLHARLK